MNNDADNRENSSVFLVKILMIAVGASGVLTYADFLCQRESSTGVGLLAHMFDFRYTEYGGGDRV